MILSDTLLLSIKTGIATIGVIVIVVGAVRSLYHLFFMIVRANYNLNYIRLQFGNSVMLGLEFMVGADIVGSLIEPDYYNLGLLAILVLIRTVLSYFLTKELDALTPQQRQALK
jgi:uncharacterized membrane protein